MNTGTAFQQTGRFLCLVSAILTIVVGMVHLISIKPRLKWPDDFTSDDYNLLHWRKVLFSFAPSVFVDAWTPLVLGLWGLLGHFKNSGSIFQMVTRNFLNAGCFQIVCGLFATMAYAGGLGISFGVVVLVTALLCFIIAFTDNASASVGFDIAYRN